MVGRLRQARGWAAALLAGAGAGFIAAAVDTGRAWPELARYFPPGLGGKLRLAAFLAAFYGALFAAAAALLGELVALLLRQTPLGTVFPGVGSGEQPAGRAPRGWQLAGSAGLAAAALGGALYLPARWALQTFHHPGLTTLLVGAIAAALALPAALLGLIGLALLACLPGGAAAPRALRGPLSLYAVGWMLALPALAGGVVLTLRQLMHNPRMTAPLRALNLALWTPLLALAALGLGHLTGRWLAGAVAGRRTATRLAGPWAVVLLPLSIGLALTLIGGLAYLPTLRLLDLRPFTTGAIAAAAALALIYLILRREGHRPRLQSRPALALAALPLLLWGLALSLGGQDRVRKAALGQVPLAAQLIHGAAKAWDLDHDGIAARWVIGGSDCDDFDPEIHPGAFDWPDNGIDENCNGHDAHAGATPPPADLPRPPTLSLGPQGKPNIVLITIDALRADHLSAYGYPRRTSPALDRLAQQPGATRFHNAWAHAPSTRYSVPAILTGRYPSTIAWGSPLAHWPPEVLPENRLISEVLKQQGYSTTALLSYHYFEPTWGLARGFTDYDTHLQTLHSLGGDPAATSGSSARELADLALAKLPALVGSGQPFFLWIHFYDPHFRYEAHPPPPGEPAFGKSEIDLYDGEIRYTDQHLGRVLSFLQASPAWDHTAVIVTSDHGEGLGEHGLPPDRRHGYHLYANQTKVPLIVRLPLQPAPGGSAALPAARVEPTPVGHVDLMPTMVHIAGVALSGQPQLTGRSLLPLCTAGGGAPADESAVVFQEVMYEGPTVRKALASSRWHLIENVIPDGTAELYDLAADPLEEHDLQGLRPQVERLLSARLAAWIDDSAIPADFARRIAGNLSAQPIAAPLPLGGRIGDYLEAIGAQVVTPQLERGQTAEVAVVLRALRRIPAGYKMFAHFRGAHGGFVNGDHDLITGLLPPQRLQPGQYVRDVMRLPVPPGFASGEATLIIGLYNRDGRVTVAGPPGVALTTDRALRVATVQVR